MAYIFFKEFELSHQTFLLDILLHIFFMILTRINYTSKGIFWKRHQHNTIINRPLNNFNEQDLNSILLNILCNKLHYYYMIRKDVCIINKSLK